MFVSEKMAALQVVYKRLSNVGLADFCFTLHSHKANKKEILRELASSISVDRKRVREEALAQLDLFEKKRQSLNEYQEQLHTPCSSLNFTIYEVNGKLSKLRDVPDLVFPIPDVDRTTIQELNERKYLLNELSKTIGKRSEDYDNNVWKGASVDYLSNELRHDIDSNVAKLIPLLHSLDDIISKCNGDLELDFEHTLAGRDKMFDLLSFLRKSCIIPQNWISDVTESLIQKAKEYKKDTEVIKSHYHDIIKIFDSGIFSIDSKRESEILKKCKTNILSVFSYKDSKELINNIELVNGKLLSYSVLFKKLFSQAESLSNTIHLRIPNNITELKRFESLLSSLLLIKDITPTNAWFNSESFKDLLYQLSEFKLLHEKYVSLSDRCLNNYDKEILNLDYYPILQRFRSEYDSIFRFFNKRYRYDLNIIRGYLRGNEKLTYKTALDVLNQLKDIHEVKEKINQIKEICKEYYGVYYQGLETKWDELNNNLLLFAKSISSVGHIPINIQNKIITGDLPFDEINQYVDLIKSSNIDEVFSDISDYLLICDNDSYKEINRIFERSIEVSDEYLGQFNKLLSYRKDKNASCTDLLLDLEIVISYQEALYSIDAQKTSIEMMYGFYYKGVEKTDWNHLIDTLYYTVDLKAYITEILLYDEPIMDESQINHIYRHTDKDE